MIRIDSSEVRALARKLASVSKDYKKAAGRVMSTTRARTGTFVKREIAKVYSLPQRRIAKGLTISKGNKKELSFTISGTNKVISAVNFKYRETQSEGVTVQYIKGGSFKPAQNKRGVGKAFTAVGRSFGDGEGRLQIFQRNGNAPMFSARGKRARTPIMSIKGPSVADMLSKAVVYDQIFKFATARLTSELQRQIAVALRG